jgi:hypothetical protein
MIFFFHSVWKFCAFNCDEVLRKLICFVSNEEAGGVLVSWGNTLALALLLHSFALTSLSLCDPAVKLEEA